MSASWRELSFLSIREVNELYRSRQLSPVELTQAHLDGIDELDGRLKSYVTLLPDQAMASARIAEKEMNKGEYRGPLHGIPFALKDLFHTKGITTEAHSKVMEGYVPDEDATVVSRLHQAGAVLLGKQAMGEFAVGSLKTELYDRPRNPWHSDYDTGGSSSGSAAAVAAGLCMAALGTDTGGSIRGPASYCGVVGLKPTYGRVSRHGVVPLSWSLDHCGPITRRVEDAACVLSAIAGYDPRDATSSNAPVADYAGALTGKVRGTTIGVPRHFFTRPETGIGQESLSAIEIALGVLEGLGAKVEEVRVPALDYFRMAHTSIMLSEAFTYHRKNLSARAMDYSDVTWNHLASGSFFTAADYVQAQRIRSSLTKDFHRVLQQVDFIAMPSTPRPAWPISQGDRVSPLEPHNFRACFNMTGMPAITVPCGLNESGLPLGLQLAGKPFDESGLLNVAHTYQQHSGHMERRPPL